MMESKLGNGINEFENREEFKQLNMRKKENKKKAKNSKVENIRKCVCI